jgi:hypothetical protein
LPARSGYGKLTSAKRRNLKTGSSGRVIFSVASSVPLLVLVAMLSIGAAPFVALVTMAVVHLALYFSLVATSKVLAGKVRTALFFGVIGMAVLGAIALWRRFTGGSNGARTPAPAQA